MVLRLRHIGSSWKQAAQSQAASLSIICLHCLPLFFTVTMSLRQTLELYIKPIKIDQREFANQTSVGERHGETNTCTIELPAPNVWRGYLHW